MASEHAARDQDVGQCAHPDGRPGQRRIPDPHKDGPRPRARPRLFQKLDRNHNMGHYRAGPRHCRRIAGHAPPDPETMHRNHALGLLWRQEHRQVEPLGNQDGASELAINGRPLRLPPFQLDRFRSRAHACEDTARFGKGDATSRPIAGHLGRKNNNR